MRVVFMGTPEFAVPILKNLARSHHVMAVYTKPDAVSGRGRRLVPPPVKVAAQDLGIDVRQPATLRDSDVVSALVDDWPEVIVVAAYGLILPPDVLGVPAHGCVNVHASVLPRYRGAAPIQRAILSDDTETGVSIMLMEQGLDTGPYALVRTVAIGERDLADLTAELAELGADALLDVLASIEDGSVTWVAQDDSAATYAAKITRDDVALEASLPVAVALKRVRASSSQAQTRILIEGGDLAVLHAVRAADLVPAGYARKSRQGLLLGLADGAVLVDRMRPAGRAPVDGAAWACGSHLTGDVEWARA